METELELTFSLQVPGPLGSLTWRFLSSTALGLRVKGTTSVEEPAVVGQLLHCSRDCLLSIGVWRMVDRYRWPLRGTSKLSKSDPAVHQH